MSKSVLLTGVAGFIGAHTLEHFLENTDWFIIGVDSLEHRGDWRRIQQVLRRNPEWHKRFWFTKLDLATGDYSKLPPGALMADYIINMASESHVDRSIETPQPFIKNNVDLTIRMLDFARVAEPDVFIQISTDEVYGPMYDRPYVEWERLVPSNPYSASKAAQEMIAISYWRTYGVPLVITNTMNNIGEMQDVEKFVPMLISKISKGEVAPIHGTPDHIGTRFYLHARNHADALLFLLRNTEPTKYADIDGRLPDRYNIVGDTELSNLEMAERVADQLGRKLHYELVDFHSTRPGHDLHYGLDGLKLEAMGWIPPLSFDESLKRTVDNYLEHPEWLS